MAGPPHMARADWIWMGESTNTPRSHIQIISNTPTEYFVVQGGTLDGVKCRSPIGYNAWHQGWESNRELRMENIGTNVIINPWISDRQHGFRTLQGLVDTIAPASMSERDRAYALWDWARKHRYHHPNGYFRAYHYQMYAPLKIFNTYGYDYCEYEAVALGALWQAAGLPTRWTRIHQHSVREVYFDKRWHMLDSDLHSFMLLPDNMTVAGMADTVTDHDLVKRVHHYGIQAPDNLHLSERVAALHVDLYQENQPQALVFDMNMQLRPGESITWRWGRRDPLRFHGAGSEINWSAKEYATVCNGEWAYAPRFSNGLWRLGETYTEDLSDTGGVLRPIGQSAGEVIWRMSSPYVFVGGSLTYTGDKVSFSFSTNLTDWTPVSTNLDEFFPGDGLAIHTYYLACYFPTPDAWLATCNIRNDIQMAPLTMPAMQVGENSFVYSDENTSRTARITHTWVEAEAEIPAPPAAPIYPADRDATEGTQITFAWETVANAKDYHFELADHPQILWPLSSNFEKLISCTTNAGTATYSLPRAGLLNPGQEYYWRVRSLGTNGVWSVWSPVWRFTPHGPGAPRHVRLKMDAGTGTGILEWNAPLDGRPATEYRVYGSNEKGFTINDEPYAVYVGNQPVPRLISPFPANFIATTTNAFLEVIGPNANWPGGNAAYYRVVAVDALGNRSGPSAMAEAPRPFLCNTNCLTIRLGESFTLALKSISSLGHLSSLKPWGAINFEYWDIETPYYALYDAPDWLACNPLTGLISGAPKAAGVYRFHALAAIENRGFCSQSITAIVLPTNPPALNNMVADYDGDGIAEAVWPVAAGSHIRVWLSSQNFRKTRNLFEGEWNESSALATGDYDGDRLADPAMYDRNTGRFTVFLSGSGYARQSFTFGGRDWLPAPGDYDGDGRTDPCFYHQPTGMWQCFCSSAAYQPAQTYCGGQDWLPAPGDYDGDGRTDPASYSAARGVWQARLSLPQYSLVQIDIGGPGWQQIPGDYDGDGRTDLAVYHEIHGAWQVRLSSANWQGISFQLGGPGWLPTCADYDGDQRMDPVVRRVADGQVIGLFSASGYAVVRLKTVVWDR
jgi:hypothetical protein